MNEYELGVALNVIAETAQPVDDFLKRFPVEIMRAYQAPASQISRVERDNAARGARSGNLLTPDDFIWPKQLHYRPTWSWSGGVHKVVEQLIEIQKPRSIPGKTAPRFLLSTDGHALAGVDLRTEEWFKGETIADLTEEYEFLQPMFGIDRYVPPVESEADVRAAKHMREIHDAIVSRDPTWREPDRAEALNTFLTRLLFCMFADGSGVFPGTGDHARPFARIINRHAGAVDGRDTRSTLGKAFSILDLPKDDVRRVAYDPKYQELPYANGHLFSQDLPIPEFNGRAQRALTKALKLDWGDIHADVFGSMIQAITEGSDADERARFGMHYTSVSNIKKVLGPLILHDLQDDLRAAGNDRRRLRALLTRLASIHVFDPACGSGNFLIVAYREMRQIETKVLKRLYGEQLDLDVSTGIRLDHFHGIDPVDFACRTARLSLWISQIQADRELAAIGVRPPAILPLHDAGDIRRGSAIDIDWNDVVDGRTETYIVGNPPYLGSTYQSADQKTDMDKVFQGRIASWRNLDFVAVWFALATDHVSKTGSKAAFVTTNSLCQGEQVPTLWPYVKGRGVEISFAYTSFRWSNLASHNAGVACAIVGLRRRDSRAPKLIYRDIDDNGVRAEFRVVRNINAYLTDGDDTVVEPTRKPINDLPEMIAGNKMTYGTHLLLDTVSKNELLQRHPEALSLIKPIMGSREFIRGEDRWCLWITDANLPIAMGIPPVAHRIEMVRSDRLASKDAQAREMASRPHQFREMNYATSTLIMPAVSSEHRDYLQCGIVSETAVSNLAFSVLDAEPWVMAVCSSRMMQQWAATIGGRLEDRIRFSNTMVYATMPMPALDEDRRDRLDEAALRIIEARQPHLDDGRNIAWLYTPNKMPAELRDAHRELDEEFEGMYIDRAFRDDAERVGHLFRLYADMRRAAA